MTPARARRHVVDIARRYFGERPRRIEPRGGGLTNHVYEFAADGAAYVVRLNDDATKLNDYRKEQWAMAAARDAGVPVPEVLEVDNAVGVPYMVARKCAGIEATACRERGAALAELGRLAARLHRVRTHGWGPVFDWSDNRLSRRGSWSDFLDLTLDAGRCMATLRRHRMLDAAQFEALEAALQDMRGWRRPAVLHHGDLRLKNLLVDESGRAVALLDWEHCLSAPAPHWDLSIALHDLGVDERQALLDGWGMAPQALAREAPFLRALNTLNYARTVAARAAAGDRQGLAWLRARLTRALDLHM